MSADINRIVSHCVLNKHYGSIDLSSCMEVLDFNVVSLFFGSHVLFIFVCVRNPEHTCI